MAHLQRSDGKGEIRARGDRQSGGNVVERTVAEITPIRYRTGKSKDIAVRLPDGLVDLLDALIARGDADSRDSIVTRALKREKRRLETLKDDEILKWLGEIRSW